MKSSSLKIFFTLFYTIIFSTLIYSQAHTFDNITEKDGLSENNVIDIFQDSWGFLWFVTPDAINHYDGYEFIKFRNDPFDSTSLSPGITTTVAEDSKEKIWIGTTRGLNKYDRFTNSFKFYSTDDGLSFHQITKIYQDSEENFWIGMGDIIGGKNKGGLAYFNYNSERFISFTNDTLDDKSLSHNHITSIVDDKVGNLWIGTKDGLNKFDKIDKAFISYYYNKDTKNERELSSVNDLLFDSKNNLWIATDTGLLIFDMESENFQNVVFDSANKTGARRVLTVYEAPSDLGVLWIGTEKGLFEYNINSGNSIHCEKQKEENESLPSNKIKKILEDHSGMLWFAAGNSGLAKLNRFRPDFKYINSDIITTFASENNVFALTLNHRGHLLAGTNESIIEINLSSKRKEEVKYIPKLKKYIKNNRIVSLYEDYLKRLWIGTSDNGIIIVDSNEVVIHIGKENSGILQSNRISFITSKNEKEIWIGTKGGGLDKIDAESLKITSYSLNDSLFNNKNNLLSYYFDTNGFMWIGTTRGIRKFDLSKNQVIPFEHEIEFDKFIGQDMILNFTQLNSNKNVLWLGTFNSGLCKLNLDTGEFKRLTTQNSGLANNTINSTLGFGNNTIWIMTNDGLVRFDSKSEEFRTYSSDDGFGKFKYNINSVLADDNGRIYFGGTKGIHHFNPSKVKKNLFVPRLVINDFLINGKTIIRKGNKSFIQHLFDEKELSLNHDQNTITIDFAALHYASPKNNRYEYQLVNFDDEPIFTTKQRKISYMNLASGDYTFILKASNADFVLSDRDIKFDITISPPFYKTWWAYSIYIIILFSLFYVYRKIEINKQLEASRLSELELRTEKAELKAEATAAQAKVVQIENERKSKELEDARKLQLSMLPESIPSSDKYEIAVYMKTASEVGGDYYDFSISDDDTLNIGFGDATGHGMQAGVVVALLKGLFVSDSADNDLSTFMLKSNNTIKRSKLGRMMMAFSLIKFKDNTLHIASAGMPPIFIYSQSNNHVEEINLMGMPLGAMLDFPYKNMQVKVNTGDAILLMSDGLPEISNKSGEQFDYFRISKMFKDIGKESPTEIINQLIEASENWIDGEPLEDDITLLVIKIK